RSRNDDGPCRDGGGDASPGNLADRRRRGANVDRRLLEIERAAGGEESAEANIQRAMHAEDFSARARVTQRDVASGAGVDDQRFAGEVDDGGIRRAVVRSAALAQLEREAGAGGSDASNAFESR